MAESSPCRTYQWMQVRDWHFILVSVSRWRNKPIYWVKSPVVLLEYLVPYLKVKVFHFGTDIYRKSVAVLIIINRVFRWTNPLKEFTLVKTDLKTFSSATSTNRNEFLSSTALKFLLCYSQYLNLVKSMPTASHVGRTKLDKERLKLCQYEVESVCQSAQELKGSTKDDGHIKDNLKAANALLQRLLNIAIEVCFLPLPVERFWCFMFSPLYLPFSANLAFQGHTRI